MSLYITMFFVDDMNDWKSEYTKFRKVDLNNCVSLSHCKILQRAQQWVRCHMKKHLGAILPRKFSHMCEIGHFYPTSACVIPLRSMRMGVSINIKDIDESQSDRGYL